MRILVFSDTHGRVQSAMDVYQQQEAQEHVDIIVHLGDLHTDAKALAVRLGAEVKNVKGNCDGSYSKEDDLILETEYGKILLTHGHMHMVEFGTDKLAYRAEELGCKAAFFGHTHKPLFMDAGGVYLLNPGSLTQPRGGNVGSYGVVTTTEDRFSASILFHDPAPFTKPKAEPPMGSSGAKGGFLRNLLNNSDRA